MENDERTPPEADVIQNETTHATPQSTKMGEAAAGDLAAQKAYLANALQDADSYLAHANTPEYREAFKQVINDLPAEQRERLVNAAKAENERRALAIKKTREARERRTQLLKEKNDTIEKAVRDFNSKINSDSSK